jgi:curved DNA-binding protein
MVGVEYRDYYVTLGVSRSATDEEIRKAFRRLARETHPDVAHDQPQAEARFREVNEAYEVLGDRDKRAKYDALGNHWKPGAEFRPPPGWGGGWKAQATTGQGHNFEFHLGGTGFSDFFEHLFGSKAGSRNDADGPTGRSGGNDVETELVVSLHEVLHGSSRRLSLQRQVNCQQCYGTGKVNSAVCPSCTGEGQILKRDKSQVRIPPGIREGQRLRLQGLGERGSGNAPAGDLFLRVRYARHPDFKVQGEHLILELAIAPWEAVLGGSATIPALEGNINIKIPAGAQQGERLRVRGRGLPTVNGERGDLHVLLAIQLPKQLTDRERALWVQLAAEAKLNARQV